MEFTSKSGASIVITEASFEAANNLWNAVMAAVSKQKISAEFVNEPDSLLNIILKIGSDDAFNSAVWPCLIRCTRDNQKITKETFSKLEVRSEYYEILVPCVKANIGPFVGSLISEFSAGLSALTPQKSKISPE